jgi:excisionase family DNA binding protein
MPKTKQEAAELLGVTTRAIENYANKGRLSVTYAKGRRGQIAVFDDAELQALKDELQQPIYPQRPQVTPEQPHTGSIVPFGALGMVEAVQATPRAIFDEYRRFVPVADKPLLKLSEAQSLTGLSRATLREAIEAGVLTAQIIGRSFRIKRSDLDAYIKKL